MKLVEMKISEFIEELSSDSPAPGGGSVAALSGALSAALSSMVCNLTIGKEKYKDVEYDMENILERLQNIRKRLLEIIEKFGGFKYIERIMLDLANETNRKLLNSRLHTRNLRMLLRFVAHM